MNDVGLEDPIADTADDVTQTLKKQSPSTSASRGEHGMRQAFREELQVDEEEEEVGFQPKRWWFTSTAFPLVAGTFGPLSSLHSICALIHPWREGVKDQTWLIAVNAVSLVLAIIANLSLLSNFGHRIRYSIAQPLTITLWYISSVLLLIPIIVIPSSSLTSAFYHALIACVMYAIISTLLLFNALGAYVFHAYPPSFAALTIPQRTLMLQTMSYVIYMALGALVFSHIEKWEYMNALYWADYTLLTVGLGTDFALMTVLGRALIIPYAAGGILILGLVIGSVRALVLERGKLKVLRRAMEKERKKWLHHLRHQQQDAPVSGLWQRAEFDVMRTVQRRAEKTRRWSSLGTSSAAFLIVWLGGAAVFMASERALQGWTFAQSLYFSYTTLLTIGYGDLYPQSAAGKPFFIVWSLLAVPTVTILISNVGDTIVLAVRRGAFWMGGGILPDPDDSLSSASKALSLRKNATKHRVSPQKKPNDNEKQDESGSSANHGLGSDIEHLGSAVADAEENAGKGQGLEAKLAREIQRIAKDVGKDGVKYDWDEWTRLLNLIGEVDVSNRNKNRAMASKKKKRKTPLSTNSETARSEEEEKVAAKEIELSWLSDDGPLFSNDSETEWVLGKLCQRLEDVLTTDLKESKKAESD